MSINFLTVRSSDVLGRAKFPAESFNVPNNHKCFDAEQVELWTKLAQAFGINLEETEYTVRAVVKNGELSLYTPYIGSNGTQAVLVWGKVKKEISSFDSNLVELSIGGTKRPAMDLFFPELDDSMTVTLMLGRGDKEDSPKEHQEFAKADEDAKKNMLRKALRQGKLHLYLSQSFERAKKLGDIAGKTVEVYGYAINRFGKYELVTSLGLVIGNTAISKKLDREPVITKEAPATLEVGLSSGKTSTGYDIYPVTLTTAADKEIPVFDFTLDENEDDMIDFTV